jgi:S-adenosyl methyltransferase
VTSEGTSPAGRADDLAGWEGDALAHRDEHPAFDTSMAHQARIYDYLLGGKDNFEADRKAGEAMIEAYPTMVYLARANRAFLGRVIRFLAAEAGIRQFLDIGTGIPTAGNTHQLAQEVAPESRVVYVDCDPVVLAHARAMLTSTPEGATDYIDADARDIRTVLEQATRTLDFSQPIAVSLIMILHAIGDDDDPHGIVAQITGAMPKGSYLAISHPASDIEPEKMADVVSRLNQLSYQQFTTRSRADVMRFFGDLELVKPGLVEVQQWRPGIEVNRSVAVWAGVGRK